MGQFPQYLWIHGCDTDFYMSNELQTIPVGNNLVPTKDCYSVGVLAGLRTDIFREGGAEKSTKYLDLFHMLC